MFENEIILKYQMKTSFKCSFFGNSVIFEMLTLLTDPSFNCFEKRKEGSVTNVLFFFLQMGMVNHLRAEQETDVS